jgi:hypothetical protein
MLVKCLIHCSMFAVLVWMSIFLFLKTQSPCATEKPKLYEQASEEKHFSSLHHWLLLSGETLSSSEDPLITALEPLDLQLDSHVTIAHLGSNLKQVLLQDVYRIGRQEPLIISPPRDWTSGQLLSPGPRRDNYNGIHLRTSVLVNIT